MILKFIKQSAFQHPIHYKFASAAAAAIDYYSLLGVQRGATTQQISQAFKKITTNITPETNASLFNRLTEAFVILSDGKARDAYDSLAKSRKFSYLSEPTTKPVTHSYIADRKAQKTKEMAKKFNIDKYGRYRGGLPRNNSELRGNSLGQTGVLYHQVDSIDVVKHPEYNQVDAAKAQSFKNFHQSQRQFRTSKRPWMTCQVDYQYFHPRRFLDKFTFWKWIVFVLFALPIFMKADIEVYKRFSKWQIEKKKKEKAQKEAKEKERQQKQANQKAAKAKQEQQKKAKQAQAQQATVESK